MSKFNTNKQVVETKNYMGEKAYTRSAKIELVNAVLTSFIEDTYYEKSSNRVERISSLVEEVAKKDPTFVAKLAIFARNDFNMRSSSHVLIGELVKTHRGDNLVGKTLQRVAIRPDDIIEIVSYVGRPLPQQIKRGAARALQTFDEYQLAKYRASGKEWSLKDVVNLVRPRRTDALNKLMSDELRNKDTWESKVSAAGGDKEKTSEAWTELLKSGKLGYMALLRNLRNIAESADPEAIKLAVEQLTDPERVKKSRQFPFRFLSAYKALDDMKGSDRSSSIAFEKDTDNTPILKEAVQTALTISIQNLPVLSGKTAILSDNSGSMGGDSGGSGAISAYSKRTSADIANLFATLYWMRADNTYIGLFGDNLISPALDRDKGLFENYEIVAEAARGAGPSTEQGIYDFFEDALKNGVKVDRVFIFSDMQIGENRWYGHKADTKQTFNQLFKKYKAFNPDIKVYSIDLKGYGTTVFSDGVMEFAGFSDKLFEIVEMAEQDRNALINRIESVEIV